MHHAPRPPRPAGTLAVLAGLLLLAPTFDGCTCNPIEQTREYAAEVLIPVEQEVVLGRQMEAEIAQQMVTLDDPEVQGYVDQLGARLLTAAGGAPPGLEFEFTVIDDDSQINAFAIPGGHIYVFTGLLEAMDNEAELAAVLGHEIAHVTERHVAERLVTTYGLQAIAALVLGENPGLLSQLVAQLVGSGVLLEHSRSAEREADRVGVATVVAAGYDPQGYVSFFSKLAELEGETPRALDFLRSHPAPEERVEHARELIEALDGPPPGELHRERFQRIVADL